MIGYEPYTEKMLIIAGQDFSHWFGVTEDDPFPDGTDLILKIFERDSGDQIGSWPAAQVLAGGAQVQIGAEELDEIPDASLFRVMVEYPDGQSLCWYRGRVWRKA